MSVTSGFFNAINHDRRYDAKQMSAIFDGIINDGVFMNIGSGMAVKANPGEEDLANMSVYVEPGRCWFNSAWTLNDAILPLELEPSELVLDRIDTIALEVDHSDAGRICQFKVLKGTPATEPIPVELEDSEYVHQHAFARVLVKSGVTQINQADITNCVGTSETPYVTGILQTINADDLIAQWQGQFELWYAGLVSDTEMIVETTRVAMQNQLTANEREFTDWFERLSLVLDGDVASHLQNEIEHLFKSLTKLSDVVTPKTEITEELTDGDLVSGKAIYDTVVDMKANFQAGVDTIYDACVEAGTTPEDKSPDAIADVIRKGNKIVKNVTMNSKTYEDSSFLSSVDLEFQNGDIIPVYMLAFPNFNVATSVRDPESTYSGSGTAYASMDSNGKIVYTGGAGAEHYGTANRVWTTISVSRYIEFQVGARKVDVPVILISVRGHVMPTGWDGTRTAEMVPTLTDTNVVVYQNNGVGFDVHSDEYYFAGSVSKSSGYIAL